MRQVREDDFGGHAPEDEGHSQAEQDEVVIAHEGRVRRVEPEADAGGVDEHGGPFEEDGGEGEVLRATGADDVVDAEGEVREEEGGEDEGHPDVEDGGGAEEGGQGDEGADGEGPDGGAVGAGEEHDCAGDYEALCGRRFSHADELAGGMGGKGGRKGRFTGWAVEVAQIKRVRMVGLPGREEHGQAGYQGCEDAFGGGAESDCCCFEEAG